MKVTILGAGEYGTALAGVLAENGNDIGFYDPRRGHKSLEDALDKAKVMVLCVPSAAAPRLLPKLPKDMPLVVASKGFLSDKYFKDFKHWSVMSGAGFADDIKCRFDVDLTITDSKIEDLFDTESFSFDYAEDRLAVLMCGALKNIYAFLAGKMGLEPETFAMRDYIEDASFEMKLILEENGADGGVIYQACGLGDLINTCQYPSRNYSFGMELWEKPGAEPEGTLEGLAALKRIKQGEIKLPDEAQYMRQMVKDCDKWV